MKTNRRNFIKTTTGLAGFGLAGSAFGAPAGGAPDAGARPGQDRAGRFNMAGFAAPPLEKVRVAIIGLGNRGPAHLSVLSRIEGVEIRALCDIRREKTAAAKARLSGTTHDPVTLSGPEDWRRVCERDDVDLVFVATPWPLHATMAAHAMAHGKHVATEVPAAGTLDECRLLVETAERTRRHCMMLENNCYLPFQMLTLNLARRGFFGEVVHADCAYNTSKMRNNFSKSTYWDMWWLRQYAARRGNLYPTHGLGPVAQLMNVNRGDRFEFLVSVESADFMMNARARELAATDDFFHPFAGMSYRGNMNVTTIRTVRGRTIMLQHDATSPSPHSLIHGIYGTHGAALFDPPPPRLSAGTHAWATPAEFQALADRHAPRIGRRLAELAGASKGGHGGTDLLEDWRLIDCLRNGLPLDQDVYDAAAWSAVVPLSDWSVRNRSARVDIPDFTGGAWETNPPNMDIELERGGNTGVTA